MGHLGLGNWKPRPRMDQKWVRSGKICLLYMRLMGLGSAWHFWCLARRVFATFRHLDEYDPLLRSEIKTAPDNDHLRPFLLLLFTVWECWKSFETGTFALRHSPHFKWFIENLSNGTQTILNCCTVRWPACKTNICGYFGSIFNKNPRHNRVD